MSTFSCYVNSRTRHRQNQIIKQGLWTGYRVATHAHSLTITYSYSKGEGLALNLPQSTKRDVSLIQGFQYIETEESLGCLCHIYDTSSNSVLCLVQECNVTTFVRLIYFYSHHTFHHSSVNRISLFDITTKIKYSANL